MVGSLTHKHLNRELKSSIAAMGSNVTAIVGAGKSQQKHLAILIERMESSHHLGSIPERAVTRKGQLSLSSWPLPKFSGLYQATSTRVLKNLMNICMIHLRQRNRIRNIVFITTVY